jgi:8-oxo-dGTP pyrophosphatase MutT (NUDIX family)
VANDAVANGTTEIKAAGGVIVRSSKEGPKILLVHRPRYNDWSFPKGKLEPDETFKHAALREVLEETGFECKMHKPSLPSLIYRDRNGRSKVVRYWLMTVLSGTFEPNDEVDLIAWVRVDNVFDRLTYTKDRAIFADLLESGRIEELLA